MKKVVVIGAGQAGASLVSKLRDGRFEGPITLIGSEPHPPYQRPPLSKKYLLGEMALDRMYLRPESYYHEQNIFLELGQSVDRIDCANKVIYFSEKKICYDDLVLATGSSPRRLPEAIGGCLKKVFTMRDLADADAMALEFVEGRHVLIIGGGYIGLEAAAVAATRGLQVTLVEMADRILNRVAAPQTSDYFRDLHKTHGVTIKEGIKLTRLNGDSNGDMVRSATLSDGTEFEIDFAIVGVGIVPATDLAKASGLKITDGIKVNSLGQTSNSAIWAAGDCCAFPYRDSELRLESVPNAIDQAEIVAQNILGAQIEYVPKPWFWSDQYDVKLQIAGLNTGFSDVITRKIPDQKSVSFWYYDDQKLIAVDAMNDPRAFMVAKRLLEAGKTVPREAISDPQVNLKTLLPP
jgi:3-phenylpropionate/trans-cinnamate dioxygenase ferredoxin reductase subunit